MNDPRDAWIVYKKYNCVKSFANAIILLPGVSDRDLTNVVHVHTHNVPDEISADAVLRTLDWTHAASLPDAILTKVNPPGKTAIFVSDYDTDRAGGGGMPRQVLLFGVRYLEAYDGYDVQRPGSVMNQSTPPGAQPIPADYFTHFGMLAEALGLAYRPALSHGARDQAAPDWHSSSFLATAIVVIPIVSPAPTLGRDKDARCVHPSYERLLIQYSTYQTLIHDAQSRLDRAVVHFQMNGEPESNRPFLAFLSNQMEEATRLELPPSPLPKRFTAGPLKHTRQEYRPPRRLRSEISPAERDPATRHLCENRARTADPVEEAVFRDSPTPVDELKFRVGTRPAALPRAATAAKRPRHVRFTVPPPPPRLPMKAGRRRM